MTRVKHQLSAMLSYNYSLVQRFCLADLFLLWISVCTLRVKNNVEQGGALMIVVPIQQSFTFSQACKQPLSFLFLCTRIVAGTCVKIGMRKIV